MASRARRYSLASRHPHLAMRTALKKPNATASVAIRETRSGILRMDLRACRKVSGLHGCRHFVVIAGEDVCALAVLAEIETLAFFFRSDAQTHDCLQREENYRAARGDEHYRDTDCDELRHEKRRIAVKQAIVSGGVD